MKAEALIAILLKIVQVEAPAMATSDDPKHVAYRESIATMANLYVEVGKQGLVVSPEVDPILLAVIGHEESRHRVNSEDGDCYGAGIYQKCQAIGAMQLSKGTPFWLSKVDGDWKGVKVGELRNPETSVKGAYRILRYWNDTCKSKGTATLMGNWVAGKCMKGPYWVGARRCAIGKAMAKALGTEFPACEKAHHDRNVARVQNALSLKKSAASKAP